jgi:hypothetical protein
MSLNPSKITNDIIEPSPQELKFSHDVQKKTRKPISKKSR